MKKTFLTLLFFPMFLTGCANVNTTLIINDNNSAELINTISYDTNLQENYFSDNINEFLDKDYIITKEQKDKENIFIAQKSVRNLAHKDLDLTSLGFKSNLPSNKFIEVKKNLFIKSFNIDCEYNFKNQVEKFKLKPEMLIQKTQSTSDIQPDYYHKYADKTGFETNSQSENDNEKTNNGNVSNQNTSGNEISSKFNIKLNSKASFNNADSVVDNVYSWNINKDEPTVIKLQYVKYNGFMITILFLGFIALLILLARKILTHDQQKRADNNNNII